MPDIYMVKKKKTIAFYLPQFHVIPENDKWWGKGFTEWSNTRKAKPLFENHYQPKTPLNENYYDLSDVTVMEKQAKLAKDYGLFGFAYYHYWFKDGKKLLEIPIENMLKNKKVDIPFCLCWANENWSRNWDGGNREVLMEQDYGGINEWDKHLEYLINFFDDSRYIKYDNAPLLLVYKPEQIDNFNGMIDFWKKKMRQKGYKDLIVIRQYPDSYFDKNFDDSRIDYTVKFEPFAAELWKPSFKKKAKFFLQKHNVNWMLRWWENLKKMKVISNRKLSIRDYDRTWQVLLNEAEYSDKLINGAFVAWDNTARNRKGIVYQGATPEKFEKYMSLLLEKESPLNLVFINAWNEWAEGAYLEPDEKYGFAWLEALKDALERTRNI